MCFKIFELAHCALNKSSISADLYNEGSFKIMIIENFHIGALLTLFRASLTGKSSW